MADPVTIIGAVSAITGIVVAVGQLITRIRKFREQWQEAHWGLWAFLTHITSLHTALMAIEQWEDDSEIERHHLLVMQLDDSMSFCNALIRRAQPIVEQLESLLLDGTLATSNKIRRLLESRDMENLSVMLNGQINALTLILQVYQWYASKTMHT
jgi:hypothetical protein